MILCDLPSFIYIVFVMRGINMSASGIGLGHMGVERHLHTYTIELVDKYRDRLASYCLNDPFFECNLKTLEGFFEF